MNRILLLGMYRFPHGDAPSNRILALAKSFRAAGFAPFVIGNGVHSEDHRTEAGGHAVDGIPFTSVRDRKDRRAARVLARLFQTVVLAIAVRRTGIGQVRFIYVTHSTVTLGLRLLCRFVWRRPLIVDCTEWHEPQQFRGGRLSPRYLQFGYKFHLLCRGRHMIGITTAICAELRRRGSQVLRVPPQVDVAAFPPRPAGQAGGRVELFYAGTARGKDDLGTALRGLLRLRPDELSRVRMTVAGPTAAEVAQLVGGVQPLRDLGGSVRCLGRIPRDEVLRRLTESHFSVLLRPITRYSTAGFPSKIPESLAAGTPPMVNLTSDLGEYLVDGENAVLVKACTAESFAAAVRRALTMPEPERDRLSANARACARERFDYRVWATPLRLFLDGVTPSNADPADLPAGAGRSIYGPVR